MRFEPHAVHPAIHLALTEDGLDLIRQRHFLGDVHDLVPGLLHQIQPLLVRVAHDDAGCPQQAGARRRTTAHRPGPGDVHRRSRSDSRLDAPVEASWQDVREEGEVFDLRHCLVFVGELQQLEVGIGDHHVIGLPALPVAQIEAVGPARDLGIGGHADLGVLLPAVAAAPASHVERDRDQVALLDEDHVSAHFDHLAGILVPQHHPFRSRESTPIDVLVTTTYICSNKLEDHAVIALVATRVDELRIVEVPNLDLPGPGIDHSTISCHREFSFESRKPSRWNGSSA